MRWLVLVIALAGTSVATTASADDKEAARAAYTEGKRHYDLGEFAEALTAFKKAYLNYEEPVFIFNIAQCYRQLGQRAEAVRSYRSFLRNYPNAPNRATVERIIGEQESAMAAEPQSTVPATTPVTPAAPAKPQS